MRTPKFFWEGMILQVLFNGNNEPNMERVVFLWYFIYLVNSGDAFIFKV